VRELVAQGFFDTPKTLAAVQERLKDKQGRDIPQTTLSPIFTRLLRSGHLDRSRNSEGNYEYTASS
jgi:predicted transcriptional regulator